MMLLRVYTDSLQSDKNARLRTYMGADLDGDPKDNFSGNELLGLHASTPKYGPSPGTIAGGLLNFPEARFTLQMPVVETEAPLRLEMIVARVEGRLADGGKRIADGNLAGAISDKEMDHNFVPAIFRQMCHAAFKPSNKTGPNPICVAHSLDPCTLTRCLAHVTTLQPSSLIGLFMKPDLDLDHDGNKDAYSIGLGFSAVSCRIKP